MLASRAFGGVASVLWKGGVMPVSAHDVAREMAARLDGRLPVIKKHKLLYYVQAWHCTWFGTPLFDEELRAWANGPVVADLWRDENYQWPVPEARQIPETGETVVRYVLARYGFMSSQDLIELTHSERPWQDAWDPFSGSRRITLEAMKSYFAEDDAADQGDIWSPAWMAGEIEASADIDEGRTEVFETLDDFLESL